MTTLLELVNTWGLGWSLMVAVFPFCVAYLVWDRFRYRRWACSDCWRRRWWVWLGSWPRGSVKAPCPLHQAAEFGPLVTRPPN